jgi:hypothetical protein
MMMAVQEVGREHSHAWYVKGTPAAPRRWVHAQNAVTIFSGGIDGDR